MGLNRLRQIGQRLARMDRAELMDRARQEFSKRQDAALARFGYDFSSHHRISKTGSNGKAGKFFFSGDSVDSVLALLCERFPDYRARTLQAAEMTCQHRFDLLGYSGLEYGDPIDWHLDAVHGKRAPRKAFYRIGYLDYAEVGDSKVTWELNRHQHFVTLAKAYRLSHDRRYADEILRQWHHWWVDNPYPVGINWASSLEVAFRSLSWIWTYFLLQGSDACEYGQELLPKLAVHGRHIEQYLSTYFSANTHLIGEGVALFFIGTLFPGLASAERWKSVGWQIVVNEAERQVRADGFYFEQSTYYHVYALDFFLHAAVLARANGIPTPKKFEDTIEKMLTALCLLGRNGPPPRFGDDDGGRLLDPRRNRTEHLLDPLVTGAVLFDRADYKTVAGGELREETVWLLGAEGVRHWDQLPEANDRVESIALPEAGFYLLATEHAQMIIDAGPLGGGSGGHGHADALNVTLQSHGRELLIDPGTYEYIGDGGDRELFRGTSMHNTLQVDRNNQAETKGPFSWKRLTESRAEQWIRGKSFNLLICSHDGYQRLDPPITHRRWVFSLNDGIYLVRDVASGQGRHRLDIAWHLAPDLQPSDQEGMFHLADADLEFALLPVQGTEWTMEVRSESWSPSYGQKAATKIVNFGTQVELPAEFAVMLGTSQGRHCDWGTLARVDSLQGEDGRVSSYRYLAKDKDYLFVFGQAGKPWQTALLSSDAEFVFRERKPGTNDERWILCHGSYARVDGGPALSCSRTVDWAEWVLNESGSAVYSSDPSAVGMDSIGSHQPGSGSRVIVRDC
jgi:Heparinase II/III-like protein/Heparinase II/III N-terminus